MKIHILGSGTPTPSLDRMGSGYLIRIDDDFILLDCGPGTYHRLLQLDVDITRVSHVFLSHLHYDHCLDYVRLLLTRWDQGAGLIPELKVYGPSPLKQMREHWSIQAIPGPAKPWKKRQRVAMSSSTCARLYQGP